jgi:hypothetical protein
MVWHSGGNAGISTMVALFPAEGLGVVALANAHDLSGVVQQVIQRVVDELFGVHPTYAPRDRCVPFGSEMRWLTDGDY